jgi:hypothetical protein
MALFITKTERPLIHKNIDSAQVLLIHALAPELLSDEMLQQPQSSGRLGYGFAAAHPLLAPRGE